MNERDEKALVDLNMAIALCGVEIALGGPGSGNWAHAGRPGKRGGSTSRSSGGMSIARGRDWMQRQSAARGGGKQLSEGASHLLNKLVSIKKKLIERDKLITKSGTIARAYLSLVSSKQKEIENIEVEIDYMRGSLSRISEAERDLVFKKIYALNDKKNGLYGDINTATKEREAERILINAELEKYSGIGDELARAEADIVRYSSSKEIEEKMETLKREAVSVRGKILDMESTKSEMLAAEKTETDEYQKALSNAKKLPASEQHSIISSANERLEKHLTNPSRGLLRADLNQEALNLLYQKEALADSAIQVVGGAPKNEREAKSWEAGVDGFRRLVGHNFIYENSEGHYVTSTDDGDLTEYQGRSYADGNTAYISPTGRERTVIHELGHTLENIDPIINAQVKIFYNRRTSGERIESLRDVTKNTNYETSEVTKKDDFINPYMGKVYVSGHTEILSMGLELFYADPIGFAKQDPEMFDFIYAVVRVGL